MLRGRPISDESLTPRTVLVTVMRLHTDAAQSTGKVDVDVDWLGNVLTSRAEMAV